MITEMLLEITALLVASLIMIPHALGTPLFPLLDGADFRLLRVADTDHASATMGTGNDLLAATTLTLLALFAVLLVHVDIAVFA
jgi:hypothetical protein